MKFDLFLSICQTEVDGFMPSEKEMFQNFFDQVELADRLGFGVAWVAETHLSCEIQKQNEKPVIPHFKGEIGLNTDILQLSHLVFARTKNIEMGSAIRNILCNGGPIAQAEMIKTFLFLHGQNPDEKRRLHLGFASGRFEFSNRPYGIRPRNEVEEQAWPAVKGKILGDATEIFLRLLKGESLSHEDLPKPTLSRPDFRTDEDWQKVQSLVPGASEIPLEPFWKFEKLAIIPKENRLDLLNLVIGTHDPRIQIRANQFLPVAVFNLSITPPAVIDETHRRMRENYHPDGGPWVRSHMPRTAMVFIDGTPGLSKQQQDQKAKERAQKAWENYWKAMEGTLDQKKVESAVGNALVGSPESIIEQIQEKYDSEDRLMLWFDFNEHDNSFVKKSMDLFMKEVAPRINEISGAKE